MRPRLLLMLLLGLLLAQPGAAESMRRLNNLFFAGEARKENLVLAGQKKFLVQSARSLNGRLKVRTTSGKSYIDYRKMIKTPEKTVAEDYAGQISLEIDYQKTDVVISLRAPVPAPWGSAEDAAGFEMELYVPAGTTVEIAAAYFDIDAVGPFSGFTVTESMSQVVIDQVNGPVDVRVSNRDLVIKRVVGIVRVANQYARIKMTDISSPDGQSIIHNDNGPVVIDGFVGEIDLRGGYGEIEASRLFLKGDNNRIRNVSAPITLALDSLTTGRLRVDNEYGLITVNIAGRVDAAIICKSGPGGTITATGLKMVPDLVSDNRFSFNVGRAGAEMRLSIREDGDIVISGPDHNGR